jgi:DNA-binding GntR family transcriptional regulator
LRNKRAQDSDLPKTRDRFAADRLREAILGGEFAPGERLEEGQLARLLQVSRTPVRVALRLLAAEGLVTVHAHRGTVVTELTSEEFQELYLIRANLEALAAEISVPNLLDDHITDLRAILDECDRAPDLKHWMDANRRFHLKMYEAADMPRLISLIEGLFNTAVPYCLQFMAKPENFKESRQSHLRLLKLCEERSSVRIAQEIREHLRIGCESILAVSVDD